MVYAEFGGQTECIMGNSKIENDLSRTSLKMFFRLSFATAKVAYIITMIILHLILHSTFQIYNFHIFKT